MTRKSMHYLVGIDKRKAHYKTDYQQNKETDRQRYTAQKLKSKENEPSVETNEHNKPWSVMSKSFLKEFIYFVGFLMIIYKNKK